MKKIALTSMLVLALMACSKNEQTPPPAPVENKVAEQPATQPNPVADLPAAQPVAEIAPNEPAPTAEPAPAAEPAPTAEPAPAAVATGCSFALKGTDAMTYTDAAGKAVPEIIIPASCSDFTIDFEHTGKMPKAAMGHNVVIAQASDIKAISAAGVKAGVKNDYLQANDPKVVAASKMVGGGEKTSVKVPVAKIKAGGFDFFCSFPGHEIKMHGKLTVK